MKDEPRFCQASENNKDAILAALQVHFSGCHKILEIGSGTGQHASYFSRQLPNLIWQCSDMPANHGSIRAWAGEPPPPNWRAPLPFTIGLDNWPVEGADGVFSANTAHIMQVDEVRLMMELVGRALPRAGTFCLYGPFNQSGEYNSEGNRQFDLQLRAEGYGGLRDIDELKTWAGHLSLTDIQAMPANNRLLVWRKD